MDVSVKLDNSSPNGSRDIRLSHFVTNNDNAGVRGHHMRAKRHLAAFCLRTKGATVTKFGRMLGLGPGNQHTVIDVISYFRSPTN